MASILILSCGTRCLLVDYFMDRENGFDKVVTTDCSVYAPALYRSDKYYIVPEMKDVNYLPAIMDICDSEGIDAILPLQEDELVLIARNRERFEKSGITPIVSDLNVVDLCRDKYLFSKQLSNSGINTVPTYLTAELNRAMNKCGTPLYIKPRFGAGSVANHIINVPESISAYVENEKEEFIIQPFLKGTEYAVNAYIDMISGDLTACYILQKIRSRAGETEKSFSVHSEAITEAVHNLCSLLHFRGPIDIDFIEQDRTMYLVEVNPRFGGIYPQTHNSGVNLIPLIANNVCGIANSPEGGDYRDGLVSFRYMTIFTIEKGEMPDEQRDHN